MLLLGGIFMPCSRQLTNNRPIIIKARNQKYGGKAAYNNVFKKWVGNSILNVGVVFKACLLSSTFMLLLGARLRCQNRLAPARAFSPCDWKEPGKQKVAFATTASLPACHFHPFAFQLPLALWWARRAAQGHFVPCKQDCRNWTSAPKDKLNFATSAHYANCCLLYCLVLCFVH